MDKCAKLLVKARETPRSLRFSELCKLAVCYGYEFKGQRGAHHKYKHRDINVPKQGAMFILQPDRNGFAKPYQVRQVVNAIEYLRSEFPDERSEI